MEHEQYNTKVRSNTYIIVYALVHAEALKHIIYSIKIVSVMRLLCMCVVNMRNDYKVHYVVSCLDQYYPTFTLDQHYDYPKLECQLNWAKLMYNRNTINIVVYCQEINATAGV